MNKIWYPKAKRFFDVALSCMGIIVLSPLFATIALLIKLINRGPVIYRQVRLGKGKRPFHLYKFRTMRTVNHQGPKFTTLDDPRVTRAGRYLRKFKLDELPQLVNILKGDMSFVGPRPELPEFVEHFPDAFDKILQIRPGITDLASIRFRDESRLINSGTDVERIYLDKILPEKLAYNLEYLEKRGFFYDLSLIFKTLHAIIFK
jgi:lipopolysaccharide/colanic/teichoic acid biosynthesis glycosyltransferase